MTLSIDPHWRMIRLWLLAVAALVFLTLIVGGATRLTESGLSIVEWKPVTGTIPPLTEQQWRDEFGKYQTIPQYRELNRDMNLQEFRAIYWWEWAHRLLGRLIGAAFLLPLIFFLWRGWIPCGMQPVLWGIFTLGALQGAVGWWMVSSGLSERVSVSQYRLAFHLTLACMIYAACLWTAQTLTQKVATALCPRLRIGAHVILALVLLQIYLGALVAGLDAGLAYNTWPLIDGAFIPDGKSLFFDHPLWRNFFENRLTVQFDHRMVAYALWIAVVLHALDSLRSSDKPMRWSALTLAAAVTLQAAIGIATLLHQAPLMLALGHQAMAVIVLTIAVLHAQGVSARRALTPPRPVPNPR